jgi:hypothetical protein
LITQHFLLLPLRLLISLYRAYQEFAQTTSYRSWILLQHFYYLELLENLHNWGFIPDFQTQGKDQLQFLRCFTLRLGLQLESSFCADLHLY